MLQGIVVFAIGTFTIYSTVKELIRDKNSELGDGQADPGTPKNAWKIIGNEFILILNTRIKISNIKQYGVDLEPNGYNRDIKIDGKEKRLKFTNKRLYITTYQRDNYKFYREQLGDEFERLVTNIDTYFNNKCSKHCL